MATLNLNGNYAEQMLSLYLWGQTTAPSPNDIADEKFIRPASAITTADIDATSYMEHVGNHFQLAEQKMFQIFFNAESRTGQKITLTDVQKHGVQQGNEIVLKHKQFVKVFYERDDVAGNIYQEADAAQLNAYHYTLDTNSADYWQRSFVFGSTKLQLDRDNVQYVFDATTGEPLRLDGVRVQPLSSYTKFEKRAKITPTKILRSKKILILRAIKELPNRLIRY